MQTLAKYKKICYHKQADFDNDKKRPHGQAVKTLPSHGRICGSIPHGATKKIQYHLVWYCIFLYAPERKRRGNLFAVVRICVSKFCRRLPLPALLLSCQLHMGNGNFRMGLYYFGAWNDAATCLPSFVNLRKQILAEELRFTEVEKIRKGMQTETAISAWGYILLRCVKRRGNLLAVVRQFAQANFCRRLPSPALLLSCQLHMGNGNFRMGLHTSSVRGNDAATCLPSFVFASANSCRRLPSPALLLSRQLHMGNGNFRMGLHTSSLRGNDAATCCRRSSICVSKFCRSSPFCGSRENPKRHANGNGNFRMGLRTSSLREKKSATSFLYDKRFSRLKTI